MTAEPTVAVKGATVERGRNVVRDWQGCPRAAWHCAPPLRWQAHKVTHPWSRP
jgi:hypothetical protein